MTNNQGNQKTSNSQVTVPQTNQKLLKAALTMEIEEFKLLPLEDQVRVVAMTKKISDKIKRMDKARRMHLESILPEKGIKGQDFSATWQQKRGSWQVDEARLMELYPDKVVRTIDPIFADDLLTKAKKCKPGEPLPEGVMYIKGEGKQLTLRTK